MVKDRHLALVCALGVMLLVLVVAALAFGVECPPPWGEWLQVNGLGDFPSTLTMDVWAFGIPWVGSGGEISVVDFSGALVGQTPTATGPTPGLGVFLVHFYGDDPSTTEDEGLVSGEVFHLVYHYLFSSLS